MIGISKIVTIKKPVKYLKPYFHGTKSF